MSTKYFLLTKSSRDPVENDEKNQIISLNDLVYLLPQVNLSYYLSNGLFEKNLIEWVKQFCSKDKNLIDAGAHTGTYALSLSNYCQHVYAFEPQKMTYYALCGSVALSNKHNITCYNVGLGSPEQCGKTQLKIVSNDGGGSTIQPCQNILREEEITIETLDHLHLDNIGLIKVDVEGNEHSLLSGARQTLERSNYPTILFESNQTNEPLFSYLSQLGYKIINIRGYTNMFLANF